MGTNAMIEFRLLEVTVPADETYIGLPGEMYQPIPEVTFKVPQYREGWPDASPPESGVAPSRDYGVMRWGKWKDVKCSSTTS